jgi:hypothetical protein
VFILSFDACIVTITWSRLFLVIALMHACSSDLPTLVCFLVVCGLARKHLVLLVDVVSGLIPLVKLDALHGSVVPAGVTILLGLCNPPHQSCGEPAKPGLLYPLMWIP